MPEYLSPGVYVEELQGRSTIEGVSTTVTGFVGPTRYGPTKGEPELLTSYLEFARYYGGADPLKFEGQDSQANFLAHAVRAFFDNGGTKLYVTRVFRGVNQDTLNESLHDGKASLALGSIPNVTLRARFPGAAGNQKIIFALKTTPNILVSGASGLALRGVVANDLVFVKSPGDGSLPSGLYDVQSDASGRLQLLGPSGPMSISLLPSTVRVHRITLTVLAQRNGYFETQETWSNLSPNPASRNAVTSIFAAEPPSRELQLSVPFQIEIQDTNFTGSNLITWLFGSDFVDNTLSLSLATNDELNGSIPLKRPTLDKLQIAYTLEGGNDGRLPTDNDYAGEPAARDPATAKITLATGLESLADIDEISIVAAPGFSYQYNANPARADAIVQHLISHCEIRMKYRVAVIDSPNEFIVSEVQDFRAKFDSSYAALYYPWPKIIDPLDPDGRREIAVAPSGFVTGIYARSDVASGVSKAPANEVALGAIDLELLLNKAQQDVLNPIGVNCFRFFPNRGFRLWGARTASSDPSWKYVNVRRYFAYVEHSIDKSTQWVVFAKNDPLTWANVQQTVYDFLYNEWKNDALLGSKPEQAFFVRCDRSTMTQNDIDNGRLVCFIGIAPIKPAEFVVFRISQFTVDAAG